MSDRGPDRSALFIHVALALTVIAVFGRVVTFGFVQYDDPTYVTENAQVLGGLSWSGFVWALGAIATGNWHPLTWLSLMLDATLGGGAPWVFHATNLLLHLLNTLLIFRLLARATDAKWPSALVAALFAVHPLHVESVAWIAERKDVLSTAFSLLTLLAYVSYARRPAARAYAGVLALFAASLLSKPMGVTLPVILLLLDFWPLRRLDPAPGALRRLRGLVVEKLPLFALAAASSVVTVMVQSRRGAVGDFESFPIWTRFANAVVTCVTYLVHALWPARLAIPYPYDLERLTAAHVVMSGVALVAITAAAARAWRTRPYLIVGWLWYLVSLLPVIGLVQVGSQAMADRYTYVPLLGIFIAVAWLAWDAVSTFPRIARVATAVALVAIVALGVRAYAQVGVWRDTVSLFQNALRVTGANAVAHNGLGLALHGEGRVEEAIDQYRRALRVSPGYVEASANLAAALIGTGRFDEAARMCEEALAMRPHDPLAHACLGAALLNQGRPDEARSHLEEALRRAPDNVSARVNLGLALSAIGEDAEALHQFMEAARLRPGDAGIHATIGTILLRRNDVERAGGPLMRALELDPDNLGALRNLGVLRARQGRAAEAERYFKDALRIDPSDEGTRLNLERVRSLGTQRD